MSIRIAINGLGRIGRAILKLVMDEPSIELVAVNDLTDVENLAYLLRFDTVYGRYSKPVGVDGVDLEVAGRKVRTLCARDPSDLPWKELGVEVEYPFFDRRAWLGLQAFDFSREPDRDPHLRLSGRWYVHPNAYIWGGYDDPLESDFDALFLGGGITWNDDNLKYLLGTVPSGAF